MQTSFTLKHNATADNHFAAEIEIGLLSQSAYISPKFLYNALGSQLFTAITLLPEYYPTNTEQNIFKRNRDQIAKVVGVGGTLIDLGAGNCKKAESFFDSLQPKHYLATDFSKQLIIPNSLTSTKRTFFYPGSSIGNFSNSEAMQLLSQIKSQAKGGGLLIGVDLIKDDSILMAAYDDPLKVSAAFNLNILRSANLYLGSNFKVEQFSHTVRINHKESRVELYLEVLEDLTVLWPGNSRTFKKGELIHTENSHKFTIDSFKRLLKNVGFETSQVWTDPKNYYAVIYAR
jgi:uncharacterized SAM-dependent methyltransferase